MFRYDYIIVGAGSAGCVLANRLSENSQVNILLIEAGPRDTNPWIHVPLGYGKLFARTDVNWAYESEPEAALNGRRVFTPRGKVLGGSSSINGLVYIRGQREDFDGWGIPSWGFDALRPYFEKAEAKLKVSDLERHEICDAFIASAASLGIPRTDDFNGARQDGAGYLQLTTRNGLRCSAATAYLKPARGRSNLTIETDAHASGIEFDGGRAAGVRYRRDGAETTVRAAREVLLCAGAVQSPQLLQLSGLGPAALLREHGIPVVADLPGVGENLQDHLLLRLVYKCAQPVTTNDDLRNLWGKARVGLQWLLFRTGPLSVGVMIGGMITRAFGDAKTPDIQFFLSTVSAEERGAKPHRFSGFTLNFYPLRPTSRGTIRIKSRDPAAAPALLFNYLSTEYDRSLMIEGTKLTRRLMATRAFAPYVLGEYKPGPAVRTDDEILECLRNNATTGFHPVGTCRMGRDAGAVVDPRLRVHGVQGLRVVDASVMPTLVSGNTNAATIMIAEKAADIIHEDTRGTE